MGALKSLIIKEVRQFTRNPFLSKLVIMYPILIVLVLPWITSMDVRDIQVAIVDTDRSEVSARINSRIDASRYFELKGIHQDYTSALRELEDDRVDVILEIPNGFGESLLSTPKKLSIRANGVNAMKASLGSQYLSQTVMQCVAEIRSERSPVKLSNPVEIVNFYNPTMDYKLFMIPALIAMLLIMIGGFLPALNLVVEKEKGTIEQINVSPVSKLTFTLSKLIPYWVICFLDLGLCMVLAKLVYGLAVAGSVWAIFLSSALFIIVISGIGVTIANLSETMQQTMFLMLFVILSFILISGLMTPIESMPQWAQTLTWFLPPTYMIEIMRSVYLKGATMAELSIDFIALAVFAVISCLCATISYKKRA